MTIFYLEPKWGNETYKYYFGTIKEIMKLNQTVKIVTSKITNVNELFELGFTDDDIVVFGLGWLGSEYFWPIEGLATLRNFKVIHYHKSQTNGLAKEQFINEGKFNLTLCTAPHVGEVSKRLKPPVKLFPYGFDADVFGIHNIKRKYDVGFSGALHMVENYKVNQFSSPNLRFRAQNILNKYYKGPKLMRGSESTFRRTNSTKRYAKMISSSKLWISTTGPIHDMSSRYFEVGACGTIPLTNKIPDEYEHIFKDGKNVIVFKDDCSDLLDKVVMLMEDTDLQREMSMTIQRDMKNAHSYRHRAVEFLELIKAG